MIGYYDYTVIATYLAAVLGVAGLFQAMEGAVLGAIVCLLLAGLLDTVDGRIARTKKNRTESEKRFGIQIDSLNDAVCFGALPAAVAYRLAQTLRPDGVPVWFTATAACFVLCGLIRLGYFNVQEEERQQATGGKRTYYLGLPITASALVTPLLYLLGLLCPGGAMAILTAGLSVTALLFILPLHIRKPNLAGIIALSLVGAAELSGLVLAAKGLIG